MNPDSRWNNWRELLALAVAVGAALTTGVGGMRWGSMVAGGSDSHCYLSHARSLASGRTHLEEPLATLTGWPSPGLTLAPAGYVPSAIRPGTSVPICSPGLSLTMAPLVRFEIAGESAAFLVVPFLGAMGVWLTYLLGCRLSDPLTGALSAALMAASPTFLFQVVQPMSDVPAMTWWLAAAVLLLLNRASPRTALAAGLAASAAILTRPNLFPLAAVLGLYAWRASVPTLLSFAGGVVPGVALTAALNVATYGSMTQTGYGSADAMFTLSHVLPNLARYPRWLIQAHTPFLALALVAPWLVGERRSVRADVLFALGMAATTLLCYLPYLIFEDWWYSRFLLPALPFLIVLGVMVSIEMLRRLSPRAGSLIACLACAGLVAWWLGTAARLRVFELQALDRHYEDAGNFVANELPANAVVLTVKDSGSVRFYSGRPTVLWDAIDPNGLDAALQILERAGYAPHLLVESDEEDAFRARFRGRSAIGALDWPYLARIGIRIKVYDAADRARYLAGDTLRTHQLPSPVHRRAQGSRPF